MESNVEIGYNEACLIIENVLDTLVEVGNGVTDDMLHKQCDELFRFRDKFLNKLNKELLKQ